MDRNYETIEYKGMFIKIYQEEDPSSPREWDNFGKMICWHRRYNLGDTKESEQYSDPEDLFLCLSELTQEQLEWAEKTYPDRDEYMQYVVKKAEALNFILPLYLYDHSGITMNTSGFSCGWDSGRVGYIYVSRKNALKNYGWKKFTKSRIEKVYAHLKSEVKVYDQFITGDVYGFQCVENEDEDGYDSFDSCGGFFGTDWESNGLFDYAKPSIDSRIAAIEADKQKAIHSHFERVKAWIRNSVPLYVRVPYNLVTANVTP